MVVMEPQALYLVHLLPTLAEVVVEPLALELLELAAAVVVVAGLGLLAQRSPALLIQVVAVEVVVETLIVLVAAAVPVSSSLDAINKVRHER